MPGQLSGRLKLCRLQQLSMHTAEPRQNADKVVHAGGRGDILADDWGALTQQAGCHQRLGQGDLLPSLPYKSSWQ